jgi:histidine phosphotransfer protein HptB
MPYRFHSHPRWPAAQAEAHVGAGGGLALLDSEALARLRELDPGDKAGLLNRVLQTYTQSLERMLAQWRVARTMADGGDAPTMRHIAHTLKSSSASVGALGLSSLCAEVEARLRDGHLEGLQTQLDLLTAEAERILAGLSS